LEHPTALFYYGISKYEQKKWGEAIIEFDKALKIYPNFSDAKYYKAICLARLEKQDKVSILYKEAKEDAVLSSLIVNPFSASSFASLYNIMARYIGPKSKIARRFGEPIFGADKVLSKRNFPPGQHGNNRRRKMSEYGVMLAEKQKAKYTYGVLERQFRNMFDKAAKADGITGEVLLQNLECRLDNVVFRLGIAPTRAAARQLVGHKHIVVDGKVVKIASAVEREIIDDFEYMLSLKASGLDLFFTDIDFIKNLMLDELKVLN
jgi:hypothetical protein